MVRRLFFRSITFSIIVAVVLCTFGTSANAAVTDAQVVAGIEKLKKRLYAKQNARGTWDPDAPGGDHTHGVNYGGSTALAVYALMEAGESFQSPRLAKAIKFLEKVEMKGTYAVASRAHVWSHLPPQFMDKLQKDVYWLEQAQHPKGHWNYTIKPGGAYDNSTTQYGLLGGWEGAKRGISVSNQYWKRVENHFLATQHENGGWDYRATGNHAGVRGSMTAAGLTCLYVTQEYLHAADFKTPGRAAKHPLQQRIKKGLTWFDKNFKPNQNPGGGHLYYYLYGCERVGLASGRKFFGKHDWYAEGAEFLLKNPPNDTVGLSYSILFLVRGRVPVFINKLEIPDFNWNNRPSDAEKLTHWVSGTVEQEMNWQVMPIGTRPEVWLEAPLLYLASHDSFELAPEQEAKIKKYIDLGGMLVTAADRSDPKFTKSVEAMMKRLYPGYSYETLEPDDELNNVVFKVSGNRLGARSIHNGVRHLAIHLPRGDASWTFHADAHADPTPWQLMVNAYYYATEKGHTRPRLSQHVVPRLRGKGDNAPQITVAKARYGGNWNPEPAAWSVQSNVMSNAGKARVTAKHVDLAKLSESEARFVHVSGTDDVAFTDAEIDAIKRHVESGGTILFENVGGRGPFAQSVMGMLRKAYPKQRLRPISLEHAVITGKGVNGYNASTVDYRVFALLRMGDVDTPRLLTINFDGQPRIIVSGEDLSSGMLGQPIWDVFGYSTDSARQLVANITLWANRANK